MRPLNILGPGPLTRRQFLQGMAVTAVAAGCGPARRTLNFYNYSLYIGPDTIKDFTARTGIRVNYDEFSSADVLFAKIKIGVTGYDLLVSPDHMMRRLIRHDLLLPLPRPAPIDKLMPKLRHPPWDREHRYSVPYLWGTVGVAYNSTKVAGQPDSWNLLWDEKLARRLTIMDEKRDAIGSALIRLGYSGNSKVPEQIDEAKQSLLLQKKLLRRITSDFVDDLIRGETWAALAYSGDTHQALESNDKLRYFVPKEGSFFFVDNLCIPRAAPHPEEAMQFIEYYFQPAVAAAVTNATGYANPLEAARPLVRPDLLNDPLSYPPPETMERLVFQEDLGEAEALWNRAWDEVKR